MDSKEFDAAYELALIDLRRRRSIHFNTIAAKCRRINGSFTNQQVSHRLSKSVKEGRVEGVGKARYRVLSQRHVHPLPLSPPPSSPARRDDRVEKLVERLIGVQQQVMLSLSSNGHSVEQMMTDLHSQLETLLSQPIENLHHTKLLSNSALNKQIMELSKKLHQIDEQREELQHDLQQRESAILHKNRQLETLKAAVFYILSELKSSLGEIHNTDNGKIVDECREQVLGVINKVIQDRDQIKSECASMTSQVTHVVDEVVSNLKATITRLAHVDS